MAKGQSLKSEFWGWGPTFEVNSDANTKGQVTMTVIIPARNEEHNISQCLESVLNQTYPKELFEIIVADDFSTDATVAIVSGFTAENVILISLSDHVEPVGLSAYKKKAIEIALSKAKGELIVTHDADCIAGPQWLETIALTYSSFRPAFMAAPVAYTNENTFLSIFQSLDFMTLQGITGAAIFKKFHYMCNGANMAYEKKAFDEVHGFEGVDHIASGDDMLLMHKIAVRYPERISFIASKKAIVRTAPMKDIRTFLNQRIRWASKTSSYKDPRIILVLSLVYLFNVWFVIAGICAFFYPIMLAYILFILFAKTVIELFFLYPVAGFFDKKLLLWWFPLAQPFHIIYTIVAGWLGTFGKYEWKGR